MEQKNEMIKRKKKAMGQKCEDEHWRKIWMKEEDRRKDWVRNKRSYIGKEINRKTIKSDEHYKRRHW